MRQNKTFFCPTTCSHCWQAQVWRASKHERKNNHRAVEDFDNQYLSISRGQNFTHLSSMFSDFWCLFFHFDTWLNQDCMFWIKIHTNQHRPSTNMANFQAFTSTLKRGLSLWLQHLGQHPCRGYNRKFDFGFLVPKFR